MIDDWDHELLFERLNEVADQQESQPELALVVPAQHEVKGNADERHDRPPTTIPAVDA